jgi:hypothetical protein
MAVLLALSFTTTLPVAAGMAKMHSASSEMSMGTSSDDCPCCDAAHRCPSDICALKCFNVSAITAEASSLSAPLPAPFMAATMPAGWCFQLGLIPLPLAPSLDLGRTSLRPASAGGVRARPLANTKCTKRLRQDNQT